MLRTVQAMKQAMRWEQAMRRVDELPAARAGLLGFVAFLIAGLVVLHLPTWGFVLGLLGLLSLLLWLALSGQPVVMLVWSEQPEAAPAIPSLPERIEELLEMIEVPRGEFWMGSPESEPGRWDGEDRHRVKLSAFAMGKYPVTQGQFLDVMGENPSFFRGDDLLTEFQSVELPVEQVSWFDAIRFCNRLSERQGRNPCYKIRELAGAADADAEFEVDWDRTANGYRLPTEAEWEYACRAGSETAHSFGNAETQLGAYAWFDANGDNRTHEVGQKKPNAWNLHDMHGNVWEWCWDRYDDYCKMNDQVDGMLIVEPSGPPSGNGRVLRGGSFVNGPRYVRSACRDWFRPERKVRDFGFRCVRNSGRQS